ncbi:hypothetical protein, partial [Luteolibacter soli]
TPLLLGLSELSGSITSQNWIPFRKRNEFTEEKWINGGAAIQWKMACAPFVFPMAAFGRFHP